MKSKWLDNGLGNTWALIMAAGLRDGLAEPSLPPPDPDPVYPPSEPEPDSPEPNIDIPPDPAPLWQMRGR